MSKKRGYYRPNNINPNWHRRWTDEVKRGRKVDELLDDLCETACGVKIGVAREIQGYAQHIHACLCMAYKIGKTEAGNNKLKERIKKLETALEGWIEANIGAPNKYDWAKKALSET